MAMKMMMLDQKEVFKTCDAPNLAKIPRNFMNPYTIFIQFRSLTCINSELYPLLGSKPKQIF